MKKCTLFVLGITFLLFLFVPASKAEQSDKVIVYYFYTNYRCPACVKLQKYTKEAIDTFYLNEIKAKTVEFKAVNVDEKENRHFIKNYQLYTKSVILSLVKDGKEQKYENLPKIWEYVRNKETFLRYIKDETDAYLTEVRL